ncbi:MAG: von Willebrand factor type A domain-containing protein, partial [Bacteroidales bacterium]|nr:von Willebrand factor type A domain-containing protein [Bacteroidales bacterium]
MKAMKIFMALLVPAALLCVASCTKGDVMNGIFMPEASYDELMPGEPEQPEGGDRFDEIVENDFIKTADQNVSTFSIDADGAAYAYMRKSLRNGHLPSPNAVRIEEYLNYFTFDYPDPTGDHTVAINGEVGECPWNPEHKLIRLGIKGKSIENGQMPAANYVFLIDVSGSMNQDDKLPLLKEGLITLTDRLNPTDRVSIVTYSGNVKLLLESTLA